MNEQGRNEADISRYTDVEYSPEGYKTVYRWGDFLEIAGGDARYAAMLIDRTSPGEPEEGLHPETLVDQDIHDSEAFVLAGRPIVPGGHLRPPGDRARALFGAHRQRRPLRRACP